MKQPLSFVFFILLTASSLLAGPSALWTDEGSGIVLRPVQHASFILQIGAFAIAVDPVGNPADYATEAGFGLILITDIHGDHLDAGLIGKLKNSDTIVAGPRAAIEKLGFGLVLSNNARWESAGLVIDALPAYNITKSRLAFHAKGRGNGYVLTTSRGNRIYISGDTEDIPEMRNLKEIDIALICMNLPYTMTPEQAASAVLEFKPRVAIPYHYRQKDGPADIEKFRKTVNAAGKTETVLLKWY